MTTVLSPHWKDLVTLLKRLMFAPVLIANDLYSAQVPQERRLLRTRCHSSEARRELHWNDTASLCFGTPKVDREVKNA
jgi:hypothetical protein